VRLVRRLLVYVGDDGRYAPWLIAQMIAVALLNFTRSGGILPLVSLLDKSGA